MKNEELFNKTVSILVNAYQKGLLSHEDCAACAVGNLVCGNMHNGDFNDWVKVYDPWDCWSNVFVTIASTKRQDINIANYAGFAKEQIDSTGYSVKELAKIEHSFETANKGENDDEYMFNGLMAVVDTLMEIHEANETEVSEAKQLFIKELV